MMSEDNNEELHIDTLNKQMKDKRELKFIRTENENIKK